MSSTTDAAALRQHWDGVYERKGPTEVSWYQPEPSTSLALIEALGVSRAAAVIDVGGGASGLAEALLRRGFEDLTVLDLSAQALDLARARLGAEAEKVQWLNQDLLDWKPTRAYDLWHDRAVFHFLVEPAHRRRYLEVLQAGLRPGGHLVVGTFASDGPEKCSGLPVARYDAEELAAAFGQGFKTLETRREDHRTPGGSTQPFTWVAMKRAQAEQPAG